MPTPSIRQQFRQMRARDFQHDAQQLFAVQHFLDHGLWPWWESLFPAFSWMDDATKREVVGLYQRDLAAAFERRRQHISLLTMTSDFREWLK